MSRPPITDANIEALKFARSCVRDMKVAAAGLGHAPMPKFDKSIATIDSIVQHHANTQTRRERRRAK